MSGSTSMNICFLALAHSSASSAKERSTSSRYTSDDEINRFWVIRSSILVHKSGNTSGGYTRERWSMEQVSMQYTREDCLPFDTTLFITSLELCGGIPKFLKIVNLCAKKHRCIPRT